jgi:hypothetical protein
MVGCTLKSENACMVWNKQVSLRINYFKLVWQLLGTTQPGTPREYGYTKLSLSLSRSLSTILQSNTSASTMQSISGAPFINVWTDIWLDGNGVLRYDVEMGLQQTHMRHFHAWIRFKLLEQVSTQLPQAPTTYLVQVCHASLRRKNAICHDGWNTTAHCTTMYHNPEIHRIRFVLCQSSWPYRFNDNQWHFNGTNQGYRENASHHESNVGLLSNPPRRHNPISRLRHGLAHPQRCLLPIGLQRTKPSQRSVLLR